jgi:hypothetical protein
MDLKNINYRGVKHSIVRNNGIEVDLRSPEGKVFTVSYGDLPRWYRGLLPKSSTYKVEYKMVRNLLNPDAGEFPIPVDTPCSCDPSTETYHCM